MLTMLDPAALPKAQSYSQGALATGAQRMLFISGQVGVAAEGNIGKDVGEQALIAIANLNAVLAEAGMDGRNLAKVTIFLTDDSLLPGFMEAVAGTLPSPPPATTLLIVKALAAPPLLVEIEAIAVG